MGTAAQQQPAPGEGAWVGEPWPHGLTSGPDGVLRLHGTALSEVAREWGTPLYVMDETDFRARARAFASAFRERFTAAGLPAARVCYASKALLCTEVARWVRDEDLGIDVCSAGELAVALRAGIAGARIVMHGNNKSVPEIEAGMSAGVGAIVVDSLVEIDRVAAAARQAGVVQPVWVRVTPGVEAHTHEYIQTAHEDQKFGFSIAAGAAREAAVAVAAQPALQLNGLHCHIGSQILDDELQGHRTAATRVLELRHALQSDLGLAIGEVVLGGGFGICYVPGDRAVSPDRIAESLAAHVAAECARLGDTPVHVGVEPGRAIAGPAGLTLYTVGTVKPVALPDGGSRWYVSVDGGMSDNIRPALYRADYHARLAARSSKAGPVTARVVGKHCETGDVVVHEAQLPGDISPGDLLAVAATGAYGYAMASAYNLTPRSAMVAVDAHGARLMVRRETVDDLLARDV